MLELRGLGDVQAILAAAGVPHTKSLPLLRDTCGDVLVRARRRQLASAAGTTVVAAPFKHKHTSAWTLARPAAAADTPQPSSTGKKQDMKVKKGDGASSAGAGTAEPPVKKAKSG